MKKVYLFKSDTLPYYCYKIIIAKPNKKYNNDLTFFDCSVIKMCLEFDSLNDAINYGRNEYNKLIKKTKKGRRKV